MKKLHMIALALSLSCLSCGGGGTGTNLNLNLPVGEPSPIVRGIFDPVSATCSTDGTALHIIQDNQNVWFWGGFSFPEVEDSTLMGFEARGFIDSENSVSFEILNNGDLFECAATLVEPLFEGTCQALDLICNFSFRRQGTEQDEEAPAENPTKNPEGEINPAPPSSDRDQDGVPDESDNCPDDPNPPRPKPLAATHYVQDDFDNDGTGDACDPDIDGDGISNESDADNCLISEGENHCVDGSFQLDSDEDGINDFDDNCYQTPNPDQADSDHNGFGDACQGNRENGSFDTDGDGVLDLFDNCMSRPNASQQDDNRNGIGDACEGAGSRAYDPCRDRGHCDD